MKGARELVVEQVPEAAEVVTVHRCARVLVLGFLLSCRSLALACLAMGAAVGADTYFGIHSLPAWAPWAPLGVAAFPLVYAGGLYVHYVFCGDPWPDLAQRLNGGGPDAVRRWLRILQRV